MPLFAELDVAPARRENVGDELLMIKELVATALRVPGLFVELQNRRATADRLLRL